MSKLLGYYVDLCHKSRHHETFHYSTVQGYTQETPNVMSIVFAGSNQRIDWINHLLFAKKQVPYLGTNKKIKVHSGFISEYLQPQIRNHLHAKVKAYLQEYPLGKIEVTGHSYGGALTIICALDLQYNFPDTVIDCVALASPRVGNKAFVKSFDRIMKNYIMIYNGEDIVPSLPPAIFGFRRVTNTVQLNKRKFWPTLGNTLKYLFLFLVKGLKDPYNIYILGDHDPKFLDRNYEVKFEN